MKLKSFQRLDLARAALVDGLIIAWATGLGKTWAMFLWPLLKLGFTHLAGRLQPRGAVLIVAPGDLHEQILREAFRVFHLPVVAIDHQNTFNKLVTGVANGRAMVPPGFYLTSYTQLCTNGVMDWPDPDKWEPNQLRAWLSVPPSEVDKFFANRGAFWRDHYETAKCTPEMTREQFKTRYDLSWQEMNRIKNDAFRNEALTRLGQAWEVLKHLYPPAGAAGVYGALAEEDRDWVLREFIRDRLKVWQQGEGEVREYGAEGSKFTIRCVYSPTVSDLSWNTFDVVVIDEGVRIKGDDTLIGRGVRQMDPQYRLVLTATPIKNRLPDFFWLAWWATGGKAGAHARFPYNGTAEDKADFAKTFLVSERNLSKEDKAKKERRPSRFTKLTAQVCNVHRLWKFIGPISVRRRKQDIGEDIVRKIRHVVRVPQGTTQAAVYKYHLEAEYRDKNGQLALGARMQALRIASAAPHAANLQAVEGAKGSLWRSPERWTPKTLTCLTLVEQMLARGEQVLIGSAFNEPLDTVSGFLREAGVGHAVLDGRVTQKKRGAASTRFQSGEVPVTLAGVESCAEGHNWFGCPNVILISYSWAYDKFEQFINRVHRLNSPRDVNLYCLLADGTMDRVLEASVTEKGDASDLVLDGKLLTESAQEMNLAELLMVAQREFDAGSKTIAEAVLAREWPALRERLTVAGREWGKVRPVRVPVAVPELNIVAWPPSQLNVVPVSFNKPATPMMPWRRRFAAPLRATA